MASSKTGDSKGSANWSKADAVIAPGIDKHDVVFVGPEGGTARAVINVRSAVSPGTDLLARCARSVVSVPQHRL
jgi:hypothetical protein